MRTIKFYSAITYYLLKYGAKLTKESKKLHSEGKPLEAYRFIDKIVLKAMRNIVKISGSKVITKGIEKVDINETYLFVANHQGNFDIPLLYTYSPIKTAFVAKKEMEKIPVLGNIMKNRGSVFLDRENPREGVKSIQKGIEILKSGESLTIFPEGKRSKETMMNEFKPGAFKLAIKSGVKVVPVVIKGSYKIMEANGGKVKPANIEIHFLDPVDSKKYKDAVQLSEKVESLIKEKAYEK